MRSTDSTSTRRAAFLVAPHAGGIFTVYLNMRAALLSHGIDLAWVGATEHPEALAADERLSAYLPWGHLIDSRGKSQEEVGAALLGKIVANRIDLVFINVLTSPAEMSVAAYLPANVIRVLVVHNITPGTYSAAMAVAPFVHASVGVSPRIEGDLVQKLRVPVEQVFCVPNCLDTGPYQNLARAPRKGPLRLLSLGRVVDTDKGVFWLPVILEKLRDIGCTLTVAGEGPDLVELKRRCAGLESRVSFIGRVGPASVPDVMASHDVLLMPSRFEGLPYTLIEGMAGGCVPVATRLRGVTDFVVRDGETGFLFSMGDTASAAQSIRRLHEDAGMIEKVSKAGREDVFGRFSIPALAEGYMRVLDRLAESPRTVQSRSGETFELLLTGGTWRRLVPKSLKNVWRKHFLR